MKPLTNRLSRLTPSLFKISYSPSYTTFVPNHIAINSAHPLHIAQRRLRNEQKREGLWWHTTNGTDISKSSCVRHWARRRLRQAFVEELEERGYDQSGRLVDVDKVQDLYVQRVVKSGRNADLTGSLRLHGVPSLVPTKYGKVKKEIREVVDMLVQSALDSALELRGEASSGGPVTSRPQNQRTQAVATRGSIVKKTVPTEQQPLRRKPTASPEVPLRVRTAHAAPRMKPKGPAQGAPRAEKSSKSRLEEKNCV